MTATTSLLPLFQRILLATDGTVTHLLEVYAEEPIEAVKLAQDLDTSRETDAGLEVSPGARLLRRRVLLRGHRSRRNLLYAEAVVVPERVPLEVLNGLLRTDQPIGSLLADARTETFREVLLVDREPAGACARHFGIDANAELLFRTYRILSRGQPVMLITEKFPADFFFRGLPA
jgi:chorismate-pyruvate lyase